MYGTTFNKLMYFESEFLTVHVCGKRKRVVGLVCDLDTDLEQARRKLLRYLAHQEYQRALFFTLNLRNKMQCVNPC